MTDKTDNKPTLAEQMTALRENYATQLDGKIDEISAGISNIKSAGNADDEVNSIVFVRNLTHKLAGSGATFGFKEVSAISLDMENACIGVIDGGDDKAKLAGFLEDKLAQLKKSGSHPDIRMAKISDSKAEIENAGTIDDRVTHNVLVLDGDENIRTRMVGELEHFGFSAQDISRPDEISAAIDDFKPDVIISDIIFDGDDKGALDIISSLRNSGQLICPVIIHTSLDDVPHRLGAVRAGAVSYLVKPVDMADIVDVLDVATADTDADPFRVLVIDDDKSLSSHTELVLKGAGMTTKALNDPMMVVDVLNDFVPELILLDLYMPQCEGHEVAAIIRQQEAFDAIPIVFLSGEQDVEKQLSAMELGGDDFLTKPIQPEHLISAVRIRAARFRELRSLMVKDSMTGLYNHTTTKQLMHNEIDRAKRLNQSIAMASLDIDHFKNVNDTYGHAVGDRVIKSLARLLRQRLRGADIIGRMGGEEFAALLTGATIIEAETIFNQIRQAFSEIVFHSDTQDEPKDFSVTLSCGIAEFPVYDSVSSLSDASDKALYSAKNGGRNKVVLA